MGATKSTYLVLLRAVNVGGKNRLPMAALREHLDTLGFSNIRTYIASGNVVLESDRRPKWIREQIERALEHAFDLDDDLVKALVLSREQLEAVIDDRPRGFGDEPAKYHSDAVFLIDLDADEAMQLFSPRDGVDRVWPGTGVIYSQRLSALRTKSRLNRIVGTPAYRSMTIRSWQTTLALLDLMR